MSLALETRQRGRQADHHGATGRGVDAVLLTIVVVSFGAPVAQGSVDVRSALALTRSSVLFADRVVLFSPWADVTRMALELAESDNARKMLEVLSQRPDVLAELIKDERHRHLMGDLAALTALGRGERSAAIGELSEAERRSVLSHVRLDRAGPSESEAEGNLLTRLADRLFPLLSRPDVHAVFDHRARDAMRQAVALHPRLESSGILARHREAEVGAGLIARLPAFPTARIDELLDLKQDLVGPLARYRAAVASLESRLSDQPGAASLDSELHHMFRAEVAPALAEIDATLIDHGLIRELARTSATSARDLVISGASLSIALSTVGEVAAALSAAAGVVGMGAHAAARAVLDRLSARRAVSQHDFYYLYRVQAASAERAES